MDRDQILAALRERILAFATLRVSRAQAEDLTQEVLVVLHEKYPNVTDLTELVPLAFQILRFKMLDAHRKSLRRGEYNLESIDEFPVTDSRNSFPEIQKLMGQTSINTIYTWDLRCRKQLLSLMGGSWE
jgi:RNA polymerase sigma-70 factor, ECF subfamily